MQQEGFKPRVASVRPDSDLPQLDRDFDYEIPEPFENQIRIGSEVSIRLGKGASPIRGFVRRLKQSSEFAGKLSPIESCSPVAVIPPSLMALCEQLAQRHACNLAEILSLCVPVPAVRVANKLNKSLEAVDGSDSSSQIGQPAERVISSGKRIFRAVGCSRRGFLEFFGQVSSLAAETRDSDEGILILAADDRTQNRIKSILDEAGIPASLFSSTLTRSQRYSLYLDALSGAARVIIGGRSASFVPLANLKHVFVWDDGDPNFVDRAAPYLTVRETIALRQQNEGFDLHMAGFVPSLSVARWIQTGFLEMEGEFTSDCKISFNEGVTKFSRQSVSSIKDALSTGMNALVIAPTPGFTDAFFCSQCNERAACRFCGSSIRATSSNELACRTCNAPVPNLVCRFCKSSDFDSGTGGAARLSQEIGSVFPGVPIRESTGASPLTDAPETATIIVSTVGVVPEDRRGYGAIVFLEAQRFLRREGLYAREEALRVWSSVIGHGASGCRVVFEGLPQALGQDFSLWNQWKLATAELRERAELSFPPIHRLASVTGSQQHIQALAESLNSVDGIRLMGITQIQDEKSQIQGESKLVISYPHKATVRLAEKLRQEQLKLLGAAQKNKRTGRFIRPLRVNMDDMKVI